ATPSAADRAKAPPAPAVFAPDPNGVPPAPEGPGEPAETLGTRSNAESSSVTISPSPPPPLLPPPPAPPPPAAPPIPVALRPFAPGPPLPPRRIIIRFAA